MLDRLKDDAEGNGIVQKITAELVDCINKFYAEKECSDDEELSDENDKLYEKYGQNKKDMRRMDKFYRGFAREGPPNQYLS